MTEGEGREGLTVFSSLLRVGDGDEVEEAEGEDEEVEGEGDEVEAAEEAVEPESAVFVSAARAERLVEEDGRASDDKPRERVGPDVDEEYAEATLETWGT